MFWSRQSTVLFVLINIITVSGILFSLDVVCAFGLENTERKTITNSALSEGWAKMTNLNKREKRSYVDPVPKRCPPFHYFVDGICTFMVDGNIESNFDLMHKEA